MICIIFLFFRNNVWALCPGGYFLNGLRKSDGENLYNIEEGQCCRPENQPDDRYDDCYDEDVSTSFDNKGWNECQRAGYYMTGLQKQLRENLLHRKTQMLQDETT